MGTRLRVMVSVAFVAACTALVLVAIPAAAQNGGGNGGGGNNGGGNGGGDGGQGAIDTSAGGDTGSNAAAESDPSVLKLGWAQDPNTLNPFVGQDEEDYTVWAINWDLPINFSPTDLSPTSGIVKSWEVSDDRKTVTMQHRARHEVVGRQADHLGRRQVVARSARRARDPVHQLHVVDHEDRHPRPRDGRGAHEATRQRDHRRPLHLRVAEAHLGQGAAQGADRRLPARPAARRQRPLRRHRLPARPDHHDGAQPELARRAGGLRRDPVHQVRQPGRGRAGPAARRDRPRPRGRGLELRSARHPGGRRDAAAATRPPTPSSPSTRARSSSAPTPTSTRRSRIGPCARRSPTGSTATR